MHIEVTDHALIRYCERVKNLPREQIAMSRENEIREEIRRVVQATIKRRATGEEPVVMIVDQLNMFRPGAPVVVTVLAGFAKIRWAALRWHQRVVGIDRETIERLSCAAH